MSIIPLKPIARQICCICILLIMAGGAVFAQDTSLRSPQKRLDELLIRYREGKLPDTLYLRGVDSIAPDLLNDDSLVEELATYRQIAFGNKDLGRNRML